MKGLIKIISFFVIIIGLASCAGTSYYMERPYVEMTFDTLSREDYVVTEQLVSEAVLSKEGDQQTGKNYKIGRINDLVKADKISKNRSNPGLDLALYNLAKENPDVDYFFNIRTEIKSTTNIFGVVQEQTVKIKAKGIKLIID